MDKYKIEVDWIKFGSIILNVVLLFVLFKGCDMNRCPGTITEVKYDTLYRDTTYHLAYKGKPVVRKRTESVIKSDTTVIKSVQSVSNPCDSVVIITNTATVDTCEYNDTLRENGKYKAVLIEMVAGEVISRQIYWANLTPEVTKTVTQTQPAKVRPLALYAGVQVGYSVRNSRIITAPSAMLSFQRLGINAAYSYDIISNAHLLGAWVKIKLK